MAHSILRAVSADHRHHASPVDRVPRDLRTRVREGRRARIEQRSLMHFGEIEGGELGAYSFLDHGQDFHESKASCG
eukprot:1106313-Rhodomonas_salina.2